MKTEHIIIALLIVCIILIIGIGYLGANNQSQNPINTNIIKNATPIDSSAESSDQKQVKSSSQKQADKNKSQDNIELCPHGFDARYCMYDDGSYADGGGRDVEYEPSPYDEESSIVETTVG